MQITKRTKTVLTTVITVVLLGVAAFLSINREGTSLPDPSPPTVVSPSPEPEVSPYLSPPEEPKNVTKDILTPKVSGLYGCVPPGGEFSAAIQGHGTVIAWSNCLMTVHFDDGTSKTLYAG